MARLHTLKLSNIKLPADEPHLNKNTLRRRQIDHLNVVDIEPHEEPLDLNSLDIANESILKLPRDTSFVVDQVVEVDVTRVAELDGECPVRGESVRLDGVGQEADGKAKFGEDLVD